MMFDRYSIAAIGLMAFIVGSYIFHFYFNLDYVISKKPSDWVDFSDYVGGLINPLLSFVSLVLLIKSLNLQNQANGELRKEIRLNQKSEKLRSFETYFFGLIEAQRASFSEFKLDFPKHLGGKSLSGVSAVRELEDQIEKMRGMGVKDPDIQKELECLDNDEHIFNTIRIFYNVVKMISERLSNDNGFEIAQRRNQFQTLISFTEFSQLRLVMISMQFIESQAATYLNSHDEFIEVLKSLGGGADLY